MSPGVLVNVQLLRDMEDEGFIELVDVDDDALDDPFAYERGIEPGGMMWRITPLGLAVRALLSQPDRDGERSDG